MYLMIFFIFWSLCGFFAAVVLTSVIILVNIFLFFLKKLQINQFNFPCEALLISAPKELRLEYFINSPSLFGISLEKSAKRFIFDKEGVIMCDYGGEIKDVIKIHYNPAYVCWFALINLNRYFNEKNEKYLENFWKQVNWLEKNRKEINNSNVWYYNFNYKIFGKELKSPWISAMAQGLAISVFCRAYKLTAAQKYIEIAKKAASIFEKETKDGGICVKINSGNLYQEYPINSIHVLDGFIFSLLGLYDLYLATKEEKYYDLFMKGINGLVNNLEKWDFKGYWSRATWHGIPLNGMYNKLNVILLEVLYYITNLRIFYDFAKKWSPDNLSIKKRLILILYWFFI